MKAKWLVVVFMCMYILPVLADEALTGGITDTPPPNAVVRVNGHIPLRGYGIIAPVGPRYYSAHYHIRLFGQLRGGGTCSMTYIDPSKPSGSASVPHGDFGIQSTHVIDYGRFLWVHKGDVHITLSSQVPGQSISISCIDVTPPIHYEDVVYAFGGRLGIFTTSDRQQVSREGLRPHAPINVSMQDPETHF